MTTSTLANIIWLISYDTRPSPNKDVSDSYSKLGHIPSNRNGLDFDATSNSISILLPPLLLEGASPKKKKKIKGLLPLGISTWAHLWQRVVSSSNFEVTLHCQGIKNHILSLVAFHFQIPRNSSLQVPNALSIKELGNRSSEHKL